MAICKRPAARQESPLWVTTAELPTSAGHPFFERAERPFRVLQPRAGVQRGVSTVPHGVVLTDHSLAEPILNRNQLFEPARVDSDGGTDEVKLQAEYERGSSWWCSSVTSA